MSTWIVEYEGSVREVTCDDGLWDCLDVAETAIQEWYEGGMFAGDPMPDSMDVAVTSPQGERVNVTIQVDWDPVFTASRAKES